MRVGINVAITNNAAERIVERMGIATNQIKKTVMRALKSNEPICQNFLDSEYNLQKQGFTTYFYRQYLGMIFVFQKKYIDTVLITVYKFNEKNRENWENKY